MDFFLKKLNIYKKVKTFQENKTVGKQRKYKNERLTLNLICMAGWEVQNVGIYNVVYDSQLTCKYDSK